MSTLSLFDSGSSEEFESLNVPDADVLYYPAFFSRSESDALFEELLRNINWKQERITLYGKTHNLPRKTAWYGDKGKSYNYSGITVEPDEWTEPLLRIKRKIEGVSDVIFNSVLLNLYRDGKDKLAWHSDDERELGKNPVIGSVSFGTARDFQLRHKDNRELDTITLPLLHGSFLLMKGTTQHFWQHQIPERKRVSGERINLTFRVIGT